MRTGLNVKGMYNHIKHKIDISDTYRFTSKDSVTCILTLSVVDCLSGFVLLSLNLHL